MKGTKKRAAVYLRVSRGVRQRKLRLVETYEESAGAVKRRPQLDALMRAAHWSSGRSTTSIPSAS
jgi:hypothetical protein